MMKPIVQFLLLLVVSGLILTLAAAVTESDVPDLTNFQQFYGRITQLPAGTFTLRLQVGSLTPAVTPVAADGSYGFSEVVKVTGTAGDTVVFTLVNRATGAPTQIGTEPYSSSAVTRKDFQYQGADAPTPPAGNVSTSNASAGPSTDRRDSTSRRRSATTPPVSTGTSACLQSWDCGLWSTCLGGIQTRSCVRSDSCDVQLARGTVASITTIPKPLEQQACQDKSQGGIVCPKTSKRCLDRNLQQCSNDGTQWVTIQSCSAGCNPTLLVCKTAEEAAVKPRLKIPWIPVAAIGGGLLLVVAIVMIILHLQKKKQRWRPVHDYISAAQNRGFSEEAIISKLVAQGWERAQVENILKKLKK